MKYHMGLRHNRHMVRMIKEENPRNPYRLGTAYGNEFEPVDNTERRRRILDQWGIQAQSPRKPEPPSTAEPLPRRSQRIYFHDLHDHDQELLTRRQHSAPLTRRDMVPGTKERIHRGRNHVVLNVESYPTINNPRR